MATTAARQVSQADEPWTPARIIPTSGIGGQEEQEKRATSAPLAVLSAVPDFARTILAHLGAPAGAVSIPDGAIVVTRGRTRWSCLVEVKTGPSKLTAERVDRYLDHARDHGFDALLTISNEITSAPTELPLCLDGRKLRRTTVRHLSWWQILTEAIVEREHTGISDPDQAWILGELIADLDNERSGAGGLEDMGEHWASVRDAARQGTLRNNDPHVR